MHVWQVDRVRAQEPSPDEQERRAREHEIAERVVSSPRKREQMQQLAEAERSEAHFGSASETQAEDLDARFAPQLLEKLQGEIEEEGKSEAAAYDKCSPIDFFRTETLSQFDED